jgi:uncharacterized protein (TIGR03067 family)
MRLLRFAVACSLVGCGAPPAADPSADRPAGGSADAKDWQGTWRLVSCTYDGEPQAGEMEWVVDGDQYKIRTEGQLGADPYPFTLDAGKKRIDVKHHDTPEGTYGGSLKGIYEIRGDSLKVCYDLTARQYPTSFDAPKGSRRVVYQFQRK